MHALLAWRAVWPLIAKRRHVAREARRIQFRKDGVDIARGISVQQTTHIEVDLSKADDSTPTLYRPPLDLIVRRRIGFSRLCVQEIAMYRRDSMSTYEGTEEAMAISLPTVNVDRDDDDLKQSSYFP